MKRLLGTALVLSLGIVAFESVSSTTPALAEGPQTAELGDGGKVKGDISNTIGEEDRIGVDLVAGCELYIKFVPKFKPDFTFFDPRGGKITLAESKGGKTIAKGLLIEETGRYEFLIKALDGTQGLYVLTAKPVWPGKIKLEGNDGDSFEIVMPVGARIKGAVKAVKSPGFVPRIDFLSAPGGADLFGPQDGRRGKATMPWVDATEYGTYAFSVGATSGNGAFRAVLKRKVPKLVASSLDVRNGINTISFSNDGVGDVFKRRCASCHSHNHAWAGKYAGAKARAIESFGRIRSGNMPPDGKIPASEISLIEQWIKTGRNR
jgi:hypothetical protein